jgi:protein subunit release factor A
MNPFISALMMQSRFQKRLDKHRIEVGLERLKEIMEKTDQLANRVDEIEANMTKGRRVGGA